MRYNAHPLRNNLFEIDMWLNSTQCAVIINVFPFCITLVGKDKEVPLQALTGPEVYRRLRLPDFKTLDK
jgi:hypothetical protein